MPLTPLRVWPFVWSPLEVGGFVGSMAVSGVAVAMIHAPIIERAAVAASQTAARTAEAIENSAAGRRFAASPSPSIPARWRLALLGAAAIAGITGLYAASSRHGARQM